MTLRELAVALIAAITLGSSPPSWAQQPAGGAPAAKPRQLVLETKPWKGDFDQMLERRQIRVLVPYSRSLFFNDKGRERGLTAELAREFERYVNHKYAKQLAKRPVTVYIIATTRDKLLTNLNEGLGDISAGNLTATPERQKIVDFVAPTDRKPVQELVVTGPKSPDIGAVEDLSGKTVHIRRASSYYDSVVALNAKLKSARKPPAARNGSASSRRSRCSVGTARSTASTRSCSPQGYQESTLDQNAKSHVGAIGVMQIMPATGAALRVGDDRYEAVYAANV
jgi:membrane-bound lytic murein transglycosylase MltF